MQLNQGDLKRFFKFVRKNSKHKWLTLLPFVVAVVFFAAANHFSDQKPPSKKHKSELSQGESEPGRVSIRALLAAAPVIVFLAILGLYVWWSKRPSAYEAYAPGIFQPRTFELTEQGFLARAERGETLTYWKFIIRFAETNDDFYVMLAARNGHLLPKRCFPTLESMAIFRNQMQLHLEQHAPAALTAGK